MAPLSLINALLVAIGYRKGKDESKTFGSWRIFGTSTAYELGTGTDDE